MNNSNEDGNYSDRYVLLFHKDHIQNIYSYRDTIALGDILKKCKGSSASWGHIEFVKCSLWK